MRRVTFAFLALTFFFGSTAFAEQYANIKPEMKCHYPRKDMSFCKVFPNFSLRHKICNPAPGELGNIEWCREDVTITERDDCGNYETYKAVVITYRPVYANGAWGKKFQRTYRKEATLVTPALVSK
ncbi:hypothetical protein VSU19_22900 [Verrucomicrobiales bacterium BCK34]|nr:hypothetical protein [Verrucomicrobiales bacterium BCK34]